MSDRFAAWTAALTTHPTLAAACARLLAQGRHRAATRALPAELPPAALDALDSLIGLPFRLVTPVRL